jgi:hypothetical protein
LGAIYDWLTGIFDRSGDLSALEEPVRAVLVEGNLERSLAGTDVLGREFAPLMPETLRTRRGGGPPLAPRGAQSREVTGYVVTIRVDTARLTFTASWPGQPWFEFHARGYTSRGGYPVPARDPYGFRPQDLERVNELLCGHVIHD